MWCEPAIRAASADLSDSSHGWYFIVKHGGIRYVIVTQALPAGAWPNYEVTFRAMLRTLRMPN